MSFVGGLLGFGGGGGNFRADSAPILQGVTSGEVGQAYNQSQSGLNQQQQFLNALAMQNGIGNQANVFNQERGLANQLQGVANGTGPNPALQQLQNTTGQNVANQAALMAGQRGSGANAGLLARQIAQQGAGIQQQAAGQGAALQAQQQLNALAQLQQQQGMMGNLAGQQISQQGGALQGLNQFGQNEQAQLLNALAQFNNANVSNVSQKNAANAGIQSQVEKGQSGLLGGVLGGVGSALGLAKGGEVPGVTSRAGRHLMSKGGPIENHMVPGKAEVKGDSLKNDKVPAVLSPGEVVIPRSVMQSDDPVKNSAKFVQAVMAKKGKPK
jgi:hypothetical protein